MKKIKAVDILAKIQFLLHSHPNSPTLFARTFEPFWLKQTQKLKHGCSFWLNSIEFLNTKISNANKYSIQTLATFAQKFIE
jgi:hypothetical protein